MLNGPTVTLTTTSNTSEPWPAMVPYFHIVSIEPTQEESVALDDHMPSRAKMFEARGFVVRWAVDAPTKLFSLFIRNHNLGQGFIFYFNSHAELMQWASSHPGVSPKRIVRRFFEAEGLAFVREDEMEVKGGEHVETMLDRLTAQQYRKYGDLVPLAPVIEEKPRELKFERMVELDVT